MSVCCVVLPTVLMQQPMSGFIGCCELVYRSALHLEKKTNNNTYLVIIRKDLAIIKACKLQVPGLHPHQSQFVDGTCWLFPWLSDWCVL